MLILAVAIFFVASAPAWASCQGSGYSWTGKGDGHSWSDSGNWDPEGTPGSEDTADIESSGTEVVVDGGQSVCDLSVSGYVDLGLAGNVDISDTLQWDGDTTNGSSIDGGNIKAGTAIIDGHTTYSGGTLTATDLLNVEGDLTLGGANLEADSSALVGGPLGTTIASNQASEGDDNGKFQVNGTLSVLGDLNAPQLDLNLAKTASVDLGGHTMSLPGLSFSRWEAGAQIDSSSSGGKLDFTNLAKVLIDGTVSIGDNTDLKIDDTAELSDGTWFGPGPGGVLKGTGELEWVNGFEAGSITLASGFRTVLDGAGTRLVTGDATTPGRIINEGNLSVVDGQFNVSGDPEYVENQGTITVKPGAVLGNSATSPNLASFENDPGATFQVEQVPGAFPPPTVTLESGSLFNEGEVHIPFGEELLMENGSGASTLARGSTVSGGGLLRIGDNDQLVVVGPTTLTDGTVLWLDGDGASIHGGAVTQAGNFPGFLDADPIASSGLPGGTFRWLNGTVDGALETEHDLMTEIADGGQGSTRSLLASSDGGATVFDLGGPSQITGTSVNVPDDAVVQIDGTLSAAGQQSGFVSAQTPDGTQKVTVGPGGSFKVDGAGSQALLDVPVINNGSIALDSGSLHLGFGYTQTGSGSSTNVPSGTQLTVVNAGGNPQSIALNGGVFRAAGTVTGTLANNFGTVSPSVDGTTPGTLTLNGDYIQGRQGTLAIPVAGARPGQFGVLADSGNVTLDGGLALEPSAGYANAAAPGDTVPFLTYAGGRSGSFATTSVTPPLSDGKPFTPSYADATKQVDAIVGEPAPPAATAPPMISGTSQQGSTLSEGHGSWTNHPTGYAYRWERCNTAGSDCSAISGATGASYTLSPADVGNTLVVQEAARNAGGAGNPASSAATAVVLPLPPANLTPPTIMGTARQGQTLTEAHGSWSNSPTAYGYRWERCNTAGSACSGIPGATGASYALTAADVGHELVVQETAANAGGVGSPSSSAPTADVASSAGTPTLAQASVAGSVASVVVGCAGAGGTSCTTTLTLTVTETLKNGTVIGVTAAAGHKGAKQRTKTIVLGDASVTVAAGQRKVVKLTLNPVGRRLLSTRRTLNVRLSIGQAGHSAASRTLTFKAKPTKRKR